MRPVNKFTTDGCSGGMSFLWKKIFGTETPWEGECVKHDIHYWIGGSAGDRLAADMLLRKNVAAMGHPMIAIAMYYAVRVGGHPSLPFAWRWGFGHKRTSGRHDYYDRHREDYVILENVCKQMNINYKEIFGGTNYD